MLLRAACVLRKCGRSFLVLFEAMDDFEMVLSRFQPFRSTAPGGELALLQKAREVKDRCELSRFEAMLLKGWQSTASKPEKRIELAVKQIAKFNTLAIDLAKVQPVLWQAYRAVLESNTAKGSSSAAVAAV